MNKVNESDFCRYENLVKNLREMRTASQFMSIITGNKNDKVANLYGDAADAIETLTSDLVSLKTVSKCFYGLGVNCWIPIDNDHLPPEGERVLVCGGLGIEIAKIEKGISIEEREKMKRGEIDDPVSYGWNLNGLVKVKRSESYRAADEGGNNEKPYCWIGSGPAQWYSQDVIPWMPLPLEYMKR